MNYYIDFQGTCWLVQYLNIMNVDYDKNTFYKFLALNRFLRYKKCIELIKNKTFLDNKPYLFLQLMNFDGSFFDIEDILQYEIIGDLNEELTDEKILSNNERTTMILLEMYENDLDYESIIFQNFFNVFGNLTIIKSKSQNEYSFLTFLPELKSGCYELTNSSLLYDKNKYIFNSLNSPLEFIDKELSLNKKVLISLDLGKSIYIDNTLMFPGNISEDTLEKFLNIDNHYYIIVDKVLENGKKYYKAFSGYNDTNELCLIEEKYLKMYINHIICDKIISEKNEKIDIFEFEECS